MGRPGSGSVIWFASPLDGEWHAGEIITRRVFSIAAVPIAPAASQRQLLGHFNVEGLRTAGKGSLIKKPRKTEKNRDVVTPTLPSSSVDNEVIDFIRKLSLKQVIVG